MSGNNKSTRSTSAKTISKRPQRKGITLLIMFAMLVYAVVAMGAVSQANYLMKNPVADASGKVYAVSAADIGDSVPYTLSHVGAVTNVYAKDPETRTHVTGTATVPSATTAGISVPMGRQSPTFSVYEPTTTTTAPPFKGDMLTVKHENAHIRTGAGTGFEEIRIARNGEKLEVLSIGPADNGVLWYKVRLAPTDEDGTEHTGYICGNYIEYTGKIPGGRAYLTFDDGPSANTLQILDILDKYHAKATFFVIYNAKYPELYGEIIKRGHTLALHSYTHDYKTIYTSDQAFFDDLEKLSDHVYGLTGYRAKYTRFPGGGSNTVSKKYNKGIMTRLSAEVERRGYRYFDWNASSGDASGNHIPADRLVANTKKDSGNRPAVVLLMHDAPAKDTTVNALPRIIEYYQSRGYRLLAIDDDTPTVHHKVLN